MCSCEQGTCPGGCACGCNHFLIPEVDWSTVSVDRSSLGLRPSPLLYDEMVELLGKVRGLDPIVRPDPNDVEAVEAFLA